MSDSPTLMDRFRQMPRALQWAALAAIGFALFFLWNQFVNPAIASIDAKCMRIEASVNAIRATESIAQRLQRPDTRDLVTSLGPVQKPLDVEQGSKQFNDVVLDVLQRNNATNQNFSSRPRGKLPKESLREITNGRQRVDRLSGELKFEATPSAATAIIAELESSPNIESIDMVRIIRDTGGKVKVQLSIEAWILSSEPAKGETL